MSRFRVAACAMAVLAGCTIGPESGPETVSVTVETLLPDLPDPASASGEQVLYLIDDGVLVETPRDLPDDVELEPLVTTLLAGPTRSEIARGLSTAIPSSTLLLDASLDDGLLRLDLSEDFADAGGDREIAAIAQIVLTVTSLPSVERVEFTLDGVAVRVPLASGALTNEAVVRADYIDLARA